MTPGIDYALAFTTGILGSLHCVGMCGGLASAFFLKIGAQRGVFPLVSYHAGRIMVYATLGAIVAALGRALERSSAFGQVQMAMMLAAGTIMIFLGLDMLRIMPWRLPIEKGPVSPLKKLFKKAAEKGPQIGSFVGGSLNGFIPCGLLYAVLINSATAGSSIKGGLLLAVFGVGTLPSMLSVSFVVGRIGARTRGMLFRLAAVVVILMGARTIYTGFVMFTQAGGNGATCH